MSSSSNIFRVVATDYNFGDLNVENEVLSEINVEVVPNQCRTEEEVIEACRTADGILNQAVPMPRRIIMALERCQVISRYGIGFDTIDVAAATEKGICVANVTDYGVEEVAIHALGLFLAAARKLMVFNREVKKGNWCAGVLDMPRPIFRLRGQIFGIIGFGNIGRSHATKLKPLGLKILANDPYISKEVATTHGVELVSLEEILRRSDYLSLHLPLNAETRRLIGEAQLKLMKPTAILINTARGPIVDEKALIKALKEKWIAGAALDVLEKEPPDPDNPLFQMDNVILTPHAAWYSEDACPELRRKAATNVRQVLSGYYPKYLVNPKVKEIVKLQ
ncbi:MAG: C-terminal binding protein [Nitrospira sp.]|nr:C-terminal binding protein [Nitrospira sp.]